MTIMNHTFRYSRLAIAALTVLLTGAAFFAPLPINAAPPQARSIVVDARAFGYEPASLTINRGDTVTLQLESSDARHGLFLDGYELDVTAEPGQSHQFTFVADRAGKFKFRCSVTCGALHPFMIGELRVEPNAPFLRAIAATLIVTVGAVGFFWRGRQFPCLPVSLFTK